MKIKSRLTVEQASKRYGWKAGYREFVTLLLDYIADRLRSECKRRRLSPEDVARLTEYRLTPADASAYLKRRLRSRHGREGVRFLHLDGLAEKVFGQTLQDLIHDSGAGFLPRHHDKTDAV